MLSRLVHRFKAVSNSCSHVSVSSQVYRCFPFSTRARQETRKRLRAHGKPTPHASEAHGIEPSVGEWAIATEQMVLTNEGRRAGKRAPPRNLCKTQEEAPNQREPLFWKTPDSQTNQKHAIVPACLEPSPTTPESKSDVINVALTLVWRWFGLCVCESDCDCDCDCVLVCRQVLASAGCRVHFAAHTHCLTVPHVHVLTPTKTEQQH